MKRRLRRRVWEVVATEWNMHGDHPLVKKFPESRLAPKPMAILSCCGRHYKEHGHMGEQVVCPGMWILEDPAEVFPAVAGTDQEAMVEYEVIE